MPGIPIHAWPFFICGMSLKIIVRISPLRFANTLSMTLITFSFNGYAKGVPITSFFRLLSGTANG